MKFVQLVTFYSVAGKFDETRDTQRLNDVLKIIQDNKATVISVVPSMAAAASAVSAV